MGRLNEAQRHRAVGMVEGGLSFREVARRMDCSHQTIMKLAERNATTGSVSDRQRPGRQKVTSQRQDRNIVLSHLRNRFRTAVKTAQETVGINNRRISASTVRRHLRERDIRSHNAYRGNVLTPIRRRNRYDWCRQHLRWTQRQWQSVMFTDESRFCIDMNDGRAKVWRRQGEHYADCCVRECSRWGGGSVMVWGGISWRYRTPLVVLEGNLTSRRYIDEVLEPVVVPFLQNHADVTLYQQDNARPHSARLTTDFLGQNNVQVLPWPAFSPDLSPIEHLWDQLGCRVFDGRHNIHNRQQLIQTLNREWEAIPQYKIQRLIRSMRRRCQATIDVNGGHTRY